MSVVLFPGQGLHYVGMGRALADVHPEARAVFAEADDVLGFALSQVAWDGPEDTLTRTRHAQPAILTHSLAALAVLRARGLEPSVVAGHSLGEWIAVVAAGVLSFRDAVRLVHQRGTYMEEALPLGAGGMLSVLGLDATVVEALCADCAQGEVLGIATYNGGGNIVLAGHRQALERARASALERGASGCVDVPVTTPFHCALMAPAAERLRAALAAVTFARPRLRIRSTIVDAWLDSESPFTSLLVDQVTAPVLWEHAIKAIAAEGLKSAVAPGPGKALVGMVRRVARGFAVVVKAEPPDFESLD